MATTGPIVLIEDDEDDIELFREAMRENEISNNLIFFPSGPEALDYLASTHDQPFLIICDVNLPRQNGIEFKTAIDSNPFLRKKSIPFIFYSTYVAQQAVNDAFSNLSVQGFFQKNDSYAEFKKTMRIIVEYWGLCRHPEELENLKIGKLGNEDSRIVEN